MEYTKGISLIEKDHEVLDVGQEIGRVVASSSIFTINADGGSCPVKRLMN